MDGNRYPADEGLLPFEDAGDDGPVTGSHHCVYGASCSFRVPDGEGLGRGAIVRANERREFPAIYCEAWVHFSEDATEIEGMRYGMMILRGLRGSSWPEDMGGR